MCTTRAEREAFDCLFRKVLLAGIDGITRDDFFLLDDRQDQAGFGADSEKHGNDLRK